MIKKNEVATTIFLTSRQGSGHDASQDLRGTPTFHYKLEIAQLRFHLS